MIFKINNDIIVNIIKKDDIIIGFIPPNLSCGTISHLMHCATPKTTTSSTLKGIGLFALSVLASSFMRKSNRLLILDGQLRRQQPLTLDLTAENLLTHVAVLGSSNPSTRAPSPHADDTFELLTISSNPTEARDLKSPTQEQGPIVNLSDQENDADSEGMTPRLELDDLPTSTSKVLYPGKFYIQELEKELEKGRQAGLYGDYAIL